MLHLKLLFCSVAARNAWKKKSLKEAFLSGSDDHLIRHQMAGHSDGVWQQFSIPFVFRQWKRQSAGQKMESHRVNSKIHWGGQNFSALQLHRLKWRKKIPSNQKRGKSQGEPSYGSEAQRCKTFLNVKSTGVMIIKESDGQKRAASQKVTKDRRGNLRALYS